MTAPDPGGRHRKRLTSVDWTHIRAVWVQETLGHPRRIFVAVLVLMIVLFVLVQPLRDWALAQIDASITQLLSIVIPFLAVTIVLGAAFGLRPGRKSKSH